MADSHWLAAGSMVAFPLMIGLVGMVGRKTRRVFRSYQERLGALNAVPDEATSSVDTRTELSIQQALDELMHGRISFVMKMRKPPIRRMIRPPTWKLITVLFPLPAGPLSASAGQRARRLRLPVHKTP